MLVDTDGNCLGLVDAVPDDVPPTEPISRHARTQASLREIDQAFAALSLMSQEGHRWLPVVDQRGKLRGVFGSREALSALARKKPRGTS